MNIAVVASKPCDVCSHGVYVIKQIQEPVTVKSKTRLIAVIVAECSHCSERAYDDEATSKMQEAYKELLNLLPILGAVVQR